MTVAHPSKYFTSTPKKLIQLELMPLVLWSLRDSQTCVFSGALFVAVAIRGRKRDLVAQFHQRQQAV